MDLVSQLQEHSSHLAWLLSDTLGTLQRDARPAALPGKLRPRPPLSSAGQAEEATQGQAQAGQPPAGPTEPSSAAANPGTGSGSSLDPGSAPAAPMATGTAAETGTGAGTALEAEPGLPVEDIAARARAIAQGLKLFRDMVDALPDDVDLSEERTLEEMKKAQEENEKVAVQLKEELDAVAEERARVEELFTRVAKAALNREPIPQL